MSDNKYSKKEQRKKTAVRFVVFLLALLMVGGIVFSSLIYVFADDLSDRKSELSDINSDIAALEKALSSGKSEASSLNSQIKSIEAKVYSANVQLKKLTTQVNETKEQINETLIELDNLQEDIDEQSTNLNSRLRAMYKNGNIGMLSILLGSKSMSDFLTNLEMAKKIYAADEELANELQEAYDKVVEKKNELTALKSKLTSQQAVLTEYKEGLAESEASLEAAKKKVESSNKDLEAQIDALNDEADRLVAEILKLQSNDAYAGGVMCWPSKASTRITSPFGYRIHPILKVKKLHTGIDIGAAMGTDILAANDGKVITAAYNAGGYGYYIMIDHGGGIVTLYAHCSKLLVKKGDVVTRGQVIAKVGSTGMSTGAHLHFEVRVNGQYVDPTTYVTAGKY